jgi:hypothetical protein
MTQAGIGRSLGEKSIALYNGDRFYSEIPDVAHHLESEGHVDSMYVTNRDGDLLYQNRRGPDGTMRDPLGARDTIVQERDRPPTAAETGQHELRVAD